MVPELLPRNTQSTISFGKTMGWKKSHSPRSLNRKTMADGGRTTHEHRFPWEDAFPLKEIMDYL